MTIKQFRKKIDKSSKKRIDEIEKTVNGIRGRVFGISEMQNYIIHKVQLSSADVIEARNRMAEIRSKLGLK